MSIHPSLRRSQGRRFPGLRSPMTLGPSNTSGPRQRTTRGSKARHAIRRPSLIRVDRRHRQAQAMTALFHKEENVSAPNTIETVASPASGDARSSIMDHHGPPSTTQTAPPSAIPDCLIATPHRYQDAHASDTARTAAAPALRDPLGRTRTVHASSTYEAVAEPPGEDDGLMYITPIPASFLGYEPPSSHWIRPFYPGPRDSPVVHAAEEDLPPNPYDTNPSTPCPLPTEAEEDQTCGAHSSTTDETDVDTLPNTPQPKTVSVEDNGDEVIYTQGEATGNVSIEERITDGMRVLDLAVRLREWV